MSEIQWKKFKSPNNIIRSVQLPSGHNYSIGNEFVDLPDFAWSEAYSVGAFSEDMVINNNLPPALLQTLQDEAALYEELYVLMKDALDNSITEAFKKDGTPNRFWLGNKLGKKITEDYVDKVWFRIQNNL